MREVIEVAIGMGSLGLLLLWRDATVSAKFWKQTYEDELAHQQKLDDERHQRFMQRVRP